ncbi:unnamed protein product [Adineta steineri]|uniref:Helix-turn-helix domain-containing protein n=1 Tax=Adineta steineri TaxID=433720 RepID=A0A815RKT0_9BILA|nr:unnamed protein product [Adineta steineri]
MFDPSRKIDGIVDRFDDIYHSYDDDLDEKDDIDIDFLQFFTNSNKNDDDNDDFNNNIVENTEQQQQLSPVLIIKKVTNNLPSYLSTNQKLFEETILPYIPKNTGMFIMEDLREIARLEHELKLSYLNFYLWRTYLHSGTGHSFDNEDNDLQPWQATVHRIRDERSRVPLCIWPEKLKLIVRADPDFKIKPGQFISDKCIDYVKRKIQDFRAQYDSYKDQLKEKKEQLRPNLTLDLEDKIKTFVEQYGIALHRIKIESQKVIIKYDYYDELIDRDFRHERCYAVQIKLYDTLCKSKLNFATAQIDVALLKQRVAYDYVSDLCHIYLPKTLATIKDQDIQQRLRSRFEKLRQRTQADMLLLHIRIAEIKMNEYQEKFDQEYKQYEQNQRRHFFDGNLTREMDYIMKEQRFKNMDERLQILYDLKLRFFRQSIYSKMNSSPSLICRAIHHLSSEQLRFLHRGPTYVLPCQMHLLSKSSTLHQILTQQIMPLREQLTKLFDKYSMFVSDSHLFQQRIEQQFFQSFSLSIPTSLEERVFYEQKLIQSIRTQLHKDQLILRRTANDYNTYYLGYQHEFQMKINDYMEQNNYFEMITTTQDEINAEQNQIIQKIKLLYSVLNQLTQEHLISTDTMRRFQIRNITNIKLPYLYFLPEETPNGEMCVKPRFSSHKNAPMYQLATFLDQILRPLYEKYAQSTSLINGQDFIQKLNFYTRQTDCLTPRTQFITFQIHNLSTRVTHQDLRDVFKQFIMRHIGTFPYKGFQADAIIELIELILSNNIFTYNGKIYRFIKGSPINLALTELLLDIYLHKWQIPLVRLTNLKQLYYGRYHHTGILTWNGSMNDFRTCILKLNEQYPDIQLTISRGLHVHFLDAYIENRNGKLYTRVYHDPMKQFFLLPYTPNHPRLLHRQWFRFALVRAVQYCCTYEDFQDERLKIELTFLANGYSLDFVKYHLQQFLKRFSSSLTSIYFNHSIYATFRIDLFVYFNEQKYYFDEDQLQQRESRIIELYYLYDWGKRHEFNQKFYHLWSTMLNENPAFQKLGLKIILTTKHCYLSNTLLTQ